MCRFEWNKGKNVKLLASSFIKYIEYRKVLLENIGNRFHSETFKVCTDLGKLFDFDLLFHVHPDSYLPDRFDIENSQMFNEIINSMPFKEKIKHESLYLEHTEFLRHTASKVETLRLKSTKKTTTSYVIKSFVCELGDKLPVITKLLSFSFCFLISEAIDDS